MQKVICPQCKKGFTHGRLGQVCCSYKCSRIFIHFKPPSKKQKAKCTSCGKEWEDYPYQNKRSKIRFCSRECCFKFKAVDSPEKIQFRRSIEYRLWREAVYARDNWTCRKYGTRGNKLHAHHIFSYAKYPKLRVAIDNGITLSEKAHREFHHKYGNNNTMEQMKKFLMDVCKNNGID
jgi:hypothetical protein